MFESEDQLLRAEKALNAQGIYPRRYFYPSVNSLDQIVGYAPMPVSENIAKRILCLPLYWELDISEVQEVVSILIYSY